MKLKIGCRLDYEATQNTPLILILKPHGGLFQTIIYQEFAISPEVPITQYLDLYGNFCQRLLSPKGKFTIDTFSIVKTPEFITTNPEAKFNLIQNLPDHTLIYLLASRFCESDKLYQTASQIIKGKSKGYEIVESLRVWVKANIKYEYNHSTSSTSALDTLAAKHGVCRDVSHLAIGLCRSVNIPARFVVGYLYKLYPMDLHAWFEAYLDGQWYTFDATQEVVTGGRVVLAYGRDAADVATATYFGNMKLLNMNVFVEKLED